MSRIILFFFIFVKVTIQSLTRPNIVLIVADDLGWNDVSYHGSNQIPTPNIDALAYNGVMLHRFYTQPTCTPSRTALLTGQYPIRSGLQGYVIIPGENRHLPHNVKLLPERLKDLGYKTALIGKWHLGSAYRNVTPTYRGFDYHYGYWQGFIGYYDHFSDNKMMEGFDMYENLTPMWSTQNEYATHLFTRKAKEVISEHNTSAPLFLMLSHLAPHAGKPGVVYEVPNATSNQQKFHYIRDEKRRKYAGMVDELDQSVGNIVSALSQKGILNNTIILFLSDNGGQSVGTEHVNSGSNWPLRGVKFTALEGGVRNVGIFYSSQLKQKGITHDGFIHISDLFPTLYAAAGGNLDTIEFDGINQWSTLMHNQKSKRREMLVNIDEVEKWSALIGANGYKLINGSGIFNQSNEGFYGDTGREAYNPPYNVTAVLQSQTNKAIDAHLTEEIILKLRRENDLGGNCRSTFDGHRCDLGEMCLFDIINDPCETTNVIHQQPDVAKTLTERLAHFWKVLQPQKNQPIDPKSNPIYFNNTWTTWLDL